MLNRRIAMRIDTLEIGDDHPVRIMGVLNVSPESFYPGSVVHPGSIGEQAGRMIDAGATLLDLGGRSTAPKSPPIDVEEERSRVGEGMRRLVDGCELGTTLICVDTQYRAVAQDAYDILHSSGLDGRFILNDVSCLTADETLAPWAAEIGCPVIIMASHGRPGDSLGIDQTLEDLQRGLDRLSRVGADQRVIVDPAIGRWTSAKTGGYDCALIKGLKRFRSLGRPILVGISRKSFIGEILGRPDPGDRLAGSLGATAVAVYNGAHIVRTHDVADQTLDTITMASAIRRAEEPCP